MGKKHQQQQAARLFKVLRQIARVVGHHLSHELDNQADLSELRLKVERERLTVEHAQAQLTHELNLKRAENERLEIQIRSEELALRREEFKARLAEAETARTARANRTGHPQT